MVVGKLTDIGMVLADRGVMVQTVATGFIMSDAPQFQTVLVGKTRRRRR